MNKGSKLLEHLNKRKQVRIARLFFYYLFLLNLNLCHSRFTICPISRALTRIIVLIQGVTPSVARMFKSSRGSHLCSTKRLLHTKILDFQGLFVFLGEKTPLSPLYLFLILIGLNLWQLYRKIVKAIDKTGGW